MNHTKELLDYHFHVEISPEKERDKGKMKTHEIINVLIIGVLGFFTPSFMANGNQISVHSRFHHSFTLDYCSGELMASNNMNQDKKETKEK